MGWLGDLVGGFTGSNARKDIDKGIGAVNANTDKSVSSIREGGAEARTYQQPYYEQGTDAFKLYGDSLGVNGAGARGVAQDLYTSDPILARMRELDAKKSSWAFNARGGYGSGAHALADSRANLENYGSWQNKLSGMGQQGQAAAGALSGIAQNEGAGIAGAYGQNSSALAGLYGQRAASENTLAQNLIGVGGVAATAYGGINNLARRPQSGGSGGY